MMSEFTVFLNTENSRLTEVDKVWGNDAASSGGRGAGTQSSIS